MTRCTESGGVPHPILIPWGKVTENYCLSRISCLDCSVGALVTIIPRGNVSLQCGYKGPRPIRRKGPKMADVAAVVSITFGSRQRRTQNNGPPEGPVPHALL